MNIFLIMLLSLFMAGYYMFFAPNTRVGGQETDVAISHSDLRSVAQCAVATHNATIAGGEFQDICVEQNKIISRYVCMDSKKAIIDCDKYDTPNMRFVYTVTGTINPGDYNEMMNILEQDFADSGTFGIYQQGVVLSGGTNAKRAIPKSVQKELDLQDGQLVYVTQYNLPTPDVNFESVDAADIICPAGTTKTYRFGRWQCVGYNIKTGCGGDTIWNSDLMKCVADETRKPLCSGEHTAVLVDDLWECVEPFGERTCPEGMVARLNYDNLAWECVTDTNKIQNLSKCNFATKRVSVTKLGTTVRSVTNPCTDCEKMIVNEEDCSFICVPDVSKINNASCYAGRASDCSGTNKAFYFGFPNAEYVENVPAVSRVSVPFDSAHSQNRRFNCLYCPDGFISTAKSFPPYVAVCQGHNHDMTKNGAATENVDEESSNETIGTEVKEIGSDVKPGKKTMDSTDINNE